MATCCDFDHEPPPQQQDNGEAGHALPVGCQPRVNVNEHSQTGVSRVTGHDSTASALPGDDTTLGTATAAQDPQEHERDPNTVDWDGPDDPANPLNWYVLHAVGPTASASQTSNAKSLTRFWIGVL